MVIPGLFFPVLSAVVSAICLAIGTQQQSKAARQYSSQIAQRSRGWLVLLTKPRWLIGLAIQAVAIVTSVWALSQAPLTIIQPIGAFSLVVTTLLNAYDRKLRLPAMTWWGCVLAVAGSLGFVVAALNVSNHDSHINAEQELHTIIAAFIIAGLCTIGWLLSRHRPKALPLVIGAGLLYGFVAVLVRVLTVRIDFHAHQWWKAVPLGVAVALLVAAILGWFFVQQAYLYGPPDLVIAGLTVIDPIVGVIIGILLLNELKDLPLGWGHIGMVLAAVIAIVGVFVLARSHPEAAQQTPTTRSRTP